MVPAPSAAERQQRLRAAVANELAQGWPLASIPCRIAGASLDLVQTVAAELGQLAGGAI